MTVNELRDLIVTTAKGYLGCKESDGSHRKIIDIYNGHKPLARGYAVKYTDSWCATFVSAVAIKCGLTDIIPTECSCGYMVELFKKLGSWKEDDAYVPMGGDIIFYDWNDTGVGDNTGWPDHVGIVVSVAGNSIKVIEGNNGNAVNYRTLTVNGRYIRGYGVPNYASKASSGTSAPAASTVKVDPAMNFTKSKAGRYKVDAADGLHLRSGASTTKTILEVMPKDSRVTCYGYHTGSWLYVVSASGKTGFCHENYLTKV